MTGAELHALAARLFPIPRSITGEGVRRSLGVLAEKIALEIHEIPTGTPVFDWTVPREWRLRAAHITAPDGRRIADAAEHNLQILGYSTPFRGRLALAELRRHLFSLPDKPALIPYRTSYYQEQWGFCLPHRLVETLPEGEYEVVVDSELFAGSLTYGELALAGESSAEVLFSTHCCHPSLANDNLSGMVVAAALAARLAARPRRKLSYRFLFLPGTIGAIAWLATNREKRAAIRHGLVLAGLGAPGGFHYKKTRNGNAPIDREVERALARMGENLEVTEFIPFGYDERQFNSPGVDLPAGSFTRTPFGRYPEYHTSADNLDFIRPEALAGALAALEGIVDGLESRECYRNLAPDCEPQLGRRGLYRAIGGDDAGRERELAILWMLNQSDGDHSLADIAERSGIALAALREATEALVAAELLELA